jgi:hypothetical protein
MKPMVVPIFTTCLLLSGMAAAQTRYAQPPDQVIDNPPSYEPPDALLRLGVGPALRIAGEGTAGGLGVSLDLGARAQGGRFSATWVRAGSDGGLSQYTAELWVDFGAQRRLRPIIGAGAGVARLDEAAPTGGLSTSTVGLGVLRGTLEYVLPVSGADARVGVDVLGALPAIRESSAPDVRGWLITMARVGVGF